MEERKMHEKEKDLIGAFLRGQTDRRGLLKGLGALGITADSRGTDYLEVMGSNLTALRKANQCS